jgi:hypothetical protein
MEEDSQSKGLKQLVDAFAAGNRLRCGYDGLTVAEQRALLSNPVAANDPQPIDYGLTHDEMRLNDLLRYTDSGTRYKDDKRSKWTRFLDSFRQHPNAEVYARVLAYKNARQLHEQYLIAVEEERQAPLRLKRSYWEHLNGYGSADGGVDIEVARGGRRGVVQCKAHIACVGPHVVRDLYGVIHHSEVDFGIIVSRGGFTRGAVDFARNKPIFFLDISDLIAMQEGRDVLATAFAAKDT